MSGYEVPDRTQAKLDTLQSDVTALKASVAALPTSVIKSIQYGSIVITSSTTSGTATITAVDTNKAALLNLGTKVSVAGQDNNITLTNSTTVTASRDAQTGGSSTVRFCVVEFN